MLNMKKLSLITFIFLWAFTLSCKKSSSPTFSDVDIPSVSRTSDMVLIYHGGQQRPVYNTGQLKHYIFRESGNQFDWLFDNFLFLEIKADINNKAYDFGSATSYTLKPTKAEWEWLLSKNFSATYGPSAIEKVLDSLDKAGHKVPSKRKITFGIPAPIIGTQWGSIDKQELDFNKNEDRLKAVKWYVDQTIAQFKAKNFKYLELDGFYWIPESVTTDLPMMKLAVDYVHQTNNKIYWIPYNYAPNADKWKEAGFDIVDGDSAIVPVMLYDAKLSQTMANMLLEEGIYVIGFFYPVVPKGKARIRVQLSAAHTKAHLDKAIGAFIKVGEKLGVI